MPRNSAPEFLEQTRAQTFVEQLLGGRSNALRAKVARLDWNRALTRLLVGLLLLVSPESVHSVLLCAARFLVLSAVGVLDSFQ